LWRLPRLGGRDFAERPENRVELGNTGARWRHLGGIGSDGQSLYAATGNTFGASTWSDGEAACRLPLDLHRSNEKSTYFAAEDWRDLGRARRRPRCTNPIPFDVQTGSGMKPLLLALGKDGKGYLLDRNDVGGVGRGAGGGDRIKPPDPPAAGSISCSCRCRFCRSWSSAHLPCKPR
jgi:hypothetical protein